jgi:hypothetical protein
MHKLTEFICVGIFLENTISIVLQCIDRKESFCANPKKGGHSAI